MERIQFGSGTNWEEQLGYSRIVRTGPLIEVTGTVAWEDGQLIGENDAYAQADFIFQKIARFLDKVGATMDHVVRTRIYVTHIERDWQAVGKAHAKHLGKIKPATSMVEVSRLIHADFLVEIEATAYMQS